MRALKAELWNYIENVCDKEPKNKILVNPKTNIIDENQNTLMNINFGLTDYGRLKYMLKMADLLKDKKKYETLMKEEKEKGNEDKAK